MKYNNGVPAGMTTLYTVYNIELSEDISKV